MMMMMIMIMTMLMTTTKGTSMKRCCHEHSRGPQIKLAPVPCSKVSATVFHRQQPVEVLFSPSSSSSFIPQSASDPRLKRMISVPIK